MAEPKLPFPIPFPQAPMATPQLPKVSQLIKPLADIESRINESISAAAGIAPPPGPNTVLYAIASSIEEGLGAGGGAGSAGGAGGEAPGGEEAVQVETVTVTEVPAGEAKVESLVAEHPTAVEAEKIGEAKEIGNEVPANPVLRIY